MSRGRQPRASGDPVGVLLGTRIDTPLAHWLPIAPHAKDRPEVVAFCSGLRTQAKATRETVGEVPDPDLADDLD